MILKHYIDFLDGNGFVEVQPPTEWKQLSLQLSFETGQEKLSSDNFTFVGDNANSINEYIEGGVLTGSSQTNGIFEGLPYQVRFTCDNTEYTILDSCLNLASDSASYSCDVVEVGIREKGKIDFVNESADSFRYEYLFSLPTGSLGKISYSDFIDIWYVQGQYPEKFEILTTSITLFVTLKEIYETTKRLLDVIAEAFSVPSGGITSALQILYLAVYLGLLIVALIDLLQKLIDLVFPFVYFHRAMYVRTLFEKGCQYLGLNFSSTIFDVGGVGYLEYYMPEKNEEGVKVGYPSTETGFASGTFGDIIRAYQEKYNAEVKIIGTTLYFEHEDYFINQSNFRIPTVYSKPNNPNGYNTSVVSSNYVISYVYDTADLNNLNNRQGTQFTAKVEPETLTNRQNNLLLGLTERNIPMTLPKVKTTMSRLESEMSGVFNAIASLINAVSSIISPSSPSIPLIPAGGQVNVLHLDTHLTSQPKCGIYLGGGKTNPNTVVQLGASNLWNNFHASRSAYGFTPFQPNQWFIYKDVQIPMCCEEYLAIKDNNYATYRGDAAKIMSINWIPYDQVANITFWVRKPYTNNLKLTTIDSENNSVVYT